jgi:hypothetical protein
MSFAKRDKCSQSMTMKIVVDRDNARGGKARFT